MDFFHWTTKIVSRNKGKSAVAASAYISGTRMENTWDGVTHDYTRKQHVIYTEVMLPPNAPQEYADRSLLWNSVEWNETKANAQLARSIELALPAELNHKQNIALVRKLVQKLFVDKGMCADAAFHDKGDGTPHAHILLTMRPLTPDGKWGDKSRLEYVLDADGNRIPAKQKGRWKTRKVYTTDWDDRGNAERWRAAAAEAINEALREAGFTQGFVDPRSYVDQGVQRIPMVHEGPDARAMEKRGIPTEVGEKNREIRQQNKLLSQLEARLARLNAWAQYEKKKDELLIAQGEDMSRPSLRYKEGMEPMKKYGGLMFVGIILGIIGVGLVGVGLYFKLDLNAGGFGAVSSSFILEFGRESGMLENLSTWDKVKLWCAENTLQLIAGGAIGIVLSFIICEVANKLNQKAIMQHSSQVVYWNCSACGTENKWNFGYCSNCHLQKPAHVQHVTYNAAEPAKPADSVLKLWFQTKRSWFIVVLLSICSIISIVSPLIAINAGGEIVWSQYMGSFFISILTNLCICGTLAYDHCSKRNIAITFSVSWLVLRCLALLKNFMSLYEIGAINNVSISFLFVPILLPLLLLLLVALKNKAVKVSVSIIAIILLSASAALSTLDWLQEFERLVGEDWFRLYVTVNEVSSWISTLAMIIVFWPIARKHEANVVDQEDQA